MKLPPCPIFDYDKKIDENWDNTFQLENILEGYLGIIHYIENYEKLQQKEKNNKTRYDYPRKKLKEQRIRIEKRLRELKNE